MGDRFSIRLKGLLIICLGCSAIPSVYARETRNLAGAIVIVKGLAEIDSMGKGSKHPARPGESIYTNDVITTSKAGAVKILLKDHSILDLSGATVFEVDQYQENHGSDRVFSAKVSEGVVRGAVTEKITGNGKFHLKTPTATMGVRGTEFVVDTQNRETKITVLQGQVEVVHGTNQLGSGFSAIRVGTGQQVDLAGNGSISKPVALDGSSLSKISSASKVADNTFTRSVVIDTSASNSGGSQQGGRSPSSTGTSSMGSVLGSMQKPDPGALPPLPPPPQVPSLPISPITVSQNGFSHLTVHIH